MKTRNKTLTGLTTLPRTSAAEPLEQRYAPATIVVTTTSDSGIGSLREALETANSNGDSSDMIVFSLDGASPYLFSPLSPLPALNSGGVTIDGTSQHGYAGKPVIQIDGDSAGSADGIAITSGSNVIKGLSITGFDATPDSAGIRIASSTASNNRVELSYVGVAPDGVTADGNSNGIVIAGANNFIWGEHAGEGNVISGNASQGLLIISGASNQVRRNIIGGAAFGESSLGNGGDGIRIESGSFSNYIGTLDSAGGNVITANGGAGVHVIGSTGNRISGNSIFANVGRGIALDEGGIPNDLGDADIGGNRLQNSPVLTLTSAGGGKLITRGTFSSTPDTSFTLEFFSSPATATSSDAEGKSYISTERITTDASGLASFRFVHDSSAAVGEVITVVATNDTTQDTSEFSAGSSVGDGVLKIKGDKHKNQKDSIRLILDDADPNLLNIFLNKRGRKPTSVVELDGICQVLVDGRGGADTLTIDITAGVIDPPAGIVFVGGSTKKLSDKLVVQGDLVGEFLLMESAYSESGAGSVTLVDSDPDTNQFKSSSIEYSGLRSIDMSRAALDAAAFRFSQSDDTVTFSASKHGPLGLAGIGLVPTSLMSPATRLEFDGRGGNDKLAFSGNPLSLGTTRLKAIAEEVDFETSVTAGEIRTEGERLFVADGMKLTATTAGMDILFSDEVHTAGATLASLALQQSIVIHSPSASGLITSGAIETNDGTFTALGASLVAEGPVTVGSARIDLEFDESVSVHNTLQAFSYSIVGAASVTIESTGGIIFHVDLDSPPGGVPLELMGAGLTFASGSTITVDFEGAPPSAHEQRQLAAGTVGSIINQGVQFSYTGDSASLHPTVFVSSSSISVAY